jgi:hypothetical protein
MFRDSSGRTLEAGCDARDEPAQRRDERNVADEFQENAHRIHSPARTGPPAT